MVDTEFSGIERFQLVAIVVGQAGKTARDITGVGIVDDGIQSLFQISLAKGEKIHAALIKLGEENQTVFQKRGTLASPQVEIGKVILTASLFAV